MSERLGNQPEIFWVVAAAGAVMVLSVLAPWAKVGFIASASGIERDGGIIYLVIAAGALSGVVHFARSGTRSLLAVGAAFAAGGLLLATLDANSLESDEGIDILGSRADIISVGWGLRAYQAGAFVFAVTGFMFFRQLGRVEKSAPDNPS
jgi:hypothetical protein